jgi:hypothetical protein
MADHNSTRGGRPAVDQLGRIAAIEGPRLQLHIRTAAPEPSTWIILVTVVEQDISVAGLCGTGKSSDLLCNSGAVLTMET